MNAFWSAPAIDQRGDVYLATQGSQIESYTDGRAVLVWAARVRGDNGSRGMTVTDLVYRPVASTLAKGEPCQRQLR